MKKSRLNGTVGPVIIKLEDEEPFPDLSTADGPYLFVERGGRSFRIDFGRINVSESDDSGRCVCLGELYAVNQVWSGKLASGGDDEMTVCRLKAEEDFSAALENLVQMGGNALNEEIRTFRRLAAKFKVPLPPILLGDQSPRELIGEIDD